MILSLLQMRSLRRRQARDLFPSSRRGGGPLSFELLGRLPPPAHPKGCATEDPPSAAPSRTRDYSLGQTGSRNASFVYRNSVSALVSYTVRMYSASTGMGVPRRSPQAHGEHQ